VDRAPTTQRPTNAAPFNEQCSADPTAAGLELLVERGLRAQTEITFANTPAMRGNATQTVRNTVTCIRLLNQLGFDSGASKAWLKDADAILEQER
jgi:hypothetical protein